MATYLFKAIKFQYPTSTKECFHHADAILNVHDIATIGRHIGRQVKEVTIKNGLHDLVLSSRDVREEVYYTMFKWLENK